MSKLSTWIHRGHMYLALFCLPWFVMYGITAIAINHRAWFTPGQDLYNTSGPSWTEVDSWPCNLSKPTENPIPKSYATQLLDIAGIQANAYGAYTLGGNKIEVYFLSFWNTKRLTYRLDQQRLSLHHRAPNIHAILTGMHSRAGYQHGGVLNKLWAFTVDVVAISFFLWVVSGMFIWWQQPMVRRLGAAVLLTGILAFAGFMILL